MALTTEAVAIYWDFENLHASLVDQLHGPGSYLASRFRPQDELIDVATIMEYALSMGPIAINRAFANWVSFNRYKVSLLMSAVELIQVFPPGANAKNGADIKLCLDVMEDMVRFPHIATFVVVGGDSDYMPLSYKVKAAGRTLVGIGSRRTTNQHWARSCHEFKFYEALLAPPAVALPPAALTELRPGPADGDGPAPLAATEPADGHVPAAAGAASAPLAGPAAPGEAASGPVPTASGDPSDPRESADAMASPASTPFTAAPFTDTDELRQLLDVAIERQQHQREAGLLVAKAMARLAQIRGEPWIQKARLRPFIQRMDPTFHESSYGFASFNELLASMGGLIDTRRGEFDHELRLNEPVAATLPEPQPPHLPPGAA